MHDFDDECSCGRCKDILARAPSRLKARARNFPRLAYIEAGYVYAPYVPLQATPTVFSSDNVKLVSTATRYSKKALRNDLHGTMTTSDLK